METINGRAVLGGVSVETLAEKYGTPLFIYEVETVRRRFHELKDAIKYPNLQIFYACKANPSLALLGALRKEGANLAVCSPGEVGLGLKAGFSVFHMLYSGDVMAPGELRAVVDRNIRLSLGSLALLERMGESSRGSEIMLRFNPEMGEADPLPPGAEVFASSRHGIPLGKMEEVKRLIGEYRLSVTGVHVHVGSGMRDTALQLDALGKVLEATGDFPDMQFFDAGGGLGFGADEGLAGKELAAFGDALTRLVQRYADRRKRPLTLAVEPGRFLVAESGFLLARVLDIKEGADYRFACTDAGFSQMPIHLLEGRTPRIINGSNANGEPRPVVVCGNLADARDFWTRRDGRPDPQPLPEVREGDLLVFPGVGAYAASLGTRYQSRFPAAEVLVDDARDRLIRRRETIQDLLATQQL